ncbi:hypothetical protein [uncultured Kordia sp.]|uniref:hypothetical protein n=1 Tax=uncultured Kordia sp. TaxID=507699 RepID=UPI0026078F9D|nr:hypothetical protein [uncultured Kordia sp.]
MKKLRYLILCLSLTACVNTKNSDTKIIETIFKEIIKTELKQDSTLGVLDKSRNNTFLDFPEFTSFFGEKDTIIQLSKKTFKNVKLYSIDSLVAYMKPSKESNKQLSEFIPAYSNESVINLSIPYGNSDKSKIICEATFLKFTNESFYTRFYSLEKTVSGYKILNTKTLDQTGNPME